MQRLIIPILLSALLGVLAVPARADGHLTCDENGKAVTASTIVNREDIRTFVRCAHAYVMANGEAEAKRAFNEDERWRSGQFYVFVYDLPEIGSNTINFVGQDQSFIDVPYGPFMDGFGNDYWYESRRIATRFGEGWVYYSFTNPTSGADEFKASYLMSIEWMGVPAVIGAGIYRQDFPGACDPMTVNAAALGAAPSPGRLQEFVRCASYVLTERGYFARAWLEGHRQWRDGSIYVYAMDMNRNQVFSGNTARVNGNRMHEWGGIFARANDQFGGRDVISPAEAFGESFLYYDAFNPGTGRVQRKVAFLKHVIANGVPLLIGSGYYLEDEGAQ